jgi:hypothetical protein
MKLDSAYYDVLLSDKLLRCSELHASTMAMLQAINMHSSAAMPLVEPCL